jgi:hypothetical protein
LIIFAIEFHIQEEWSEPTNVCNGENPSIRVVPFNAAPEFCGNSTQSLLIKNNEGDKLRNKTFISDCRRPTKINGKVRVR